MQSKSKGVTYYAHTSETETGDSNPDKLSWNLLAKHLRNVGIKAEKFAEPLLANAAKQAGLLHDLGKYRIQFQEYLEGKIPGSENTHHAVYGAALCFKRGWVGPSFAIAGHHAGLHNRSDLKKLVCGKKYSAMDQLSSLEELFETELEKIPSELNEPEFAKKEDKAIAEFYVRMLFSCLVDADFLDTEQFKNRRERCPLKIDSELMLKRLQTHHSKFDSSREINQLRSGIFQDCLRKAAEPRGFFSLTVPTGGGKTFSSMAFAVEHVRRHKMQRIIVVIPYLSIIEQNASEYRRVLDPENKGIVIEDHSSVGSKDDEEEQGRTLEEMAAENWEAPIIVTTSVQFIESLFSNRTSKCRKLHNIANSVVLLDEVQTLPSHLLDPLLHVLRDLKENYRTSFVLSTATQPSFKYSTSLKNGFKARELQEIVSQPDKLFQRLRRVTYEVRSETNDWPELAEEWETCPQVLGVVNTRKQAVAWWEFLRNRHLKGIFHLSSAMCADHRTEVLGKVKRCLENKKSCRLVATQVIEAGVDIDFPLVYRALGPLDSIVQAAGRCNREGRLKKGRMIVFKPTDAKLPKGVYSVATNITARLLSQPKHLSTDDLSRDPSLFSCYFNELFQYVPTDHQHRRESSIQEDREALRFRDVAGKARVITDDTQPVIAPRVKALEEVNKIRKRPQASSSRFTRGDLRNLQRFMVNLHRRDFQQLNTMELLHPLLPGMELCVLDKAAYHEYLGVIIDQRPTEDFLL